MNWLKQLSSRQEFGNLEVIEESVRKVWRWTHVEDFFLDMRHGLRALRQHARQFLCEVLKQAHTGRPARTNPSLDLRNRLPVPLAAFP